MESVSAQALIQVDVRELLFATDLYKIARFESNRLKRYKFIKPKIMNNPHILVVLTELIFFEPFKLKTQLKFL